MNNKFNVGDIIQHNRVKVYHSLITSVDTVLKTYRILYLNTEEQTTLSFGYCHKEYNVVARIS